MPTDDSLWPQNRQRLDGIWHQPIQPNKDQAIHGIKGQSLRQMPPLDVELMTKDQDLSFQRGPRPEQYDQHRPDQAANFSHKAEALRDSASLASRIRFPTGTAGGPTALSRHFILGKSEMTRLSSFATRLWTYGRAWWALPARFSRTRSTRRSAPPSWGRARGPSASSHIRRGAALPQIPSAR
jgi:hypothetical protein